MVVAPPPPLPLLQTMNVCLQISSAISKDIIGLFRSTIQASGFGLRLLVATLEFSGRL